MRTERCDWCNNPEHVITLYEIHEDAVISEPRRVCYKHLYPGVDSCPYKVYSYVPDLEKNSEKVKTVYRIWKTGDDFKESLAKRCDWFKKNASNPG